jgi:carbonic anhydrase
MKTSAVTRIFLLALLMTGMNLQAEGGAAAKGADLQRAWTAFGELQAGNKRFFEGDMKHPRQEISDRVAVAKGQKPHTIVLACSDSHVGPEAVFDQGLGDLFVVRNAGNVVNYDSIASIEYAVEHLDVKLLLVMGHDSCGAVGAAVKTPKGKSAGSVSLDSLVSKIQRNINVSKAHTLKEANYHTSVKENVSSVMSTLWHASAIVRKAATEKGLVLAQAVYALDSGKVEFWDLGRTTYSLPTKESPKLREIASVKKEEAKVEEKKVEEKKVEGKDTVKKVKKDYLKKYQTNS